MVHWEERAGPIYVYVHIENHTGHTIIERFTAMYGAGGVMLTHLKPQTDHNSPEGSEHRGGHSSTGHAVIDQGMHSPRLPAHSFHHTNPINAFLRRKL